MREESRRRESEPEVERVSFKAYQAPVLDVAQVAPRNSWESCECCRRNVVNELRLFDNSPSSPARATLDFIINVSKIFA